MTNALRIHRIQILSTLLITLLSCTSVHAGDISPDLQVKLDVYKTKLTEWAKDPVIVKAVMQANDEAKKMNNKT